MVTAVLFVHSPLVGPSTWAPAAELMASHAFTVCVPDLTVVAHASPPMWRSLVEAAVAGAAPLTDEIAVAVRERGRGSASRCARAGAADAGPRRRTGT